MAFDGTLVMAVVQELNAKLLHARIDRVFQPEREEIHLLLRQPGQTYRLLISAQVNRARIHLTGESKPNPAQPPLFCMVLRKHLEGGRLVQIEQPPLERIIYLSIESPDELGEITRKILACEIMGKHSNIILFDAASKVILDGIKRYTHAVSRHREVLPGKLYVAPPAQDKTNPLSLKTDELHHIIWKDNWEQTVSRILFTKIAGLSPVLARELVYRAGLKEHTLMEECGEYELSRLEQEMALYRHALLNQDYQPTLIVKENMNADQWERTMRPYGTNQPDKNKLADALDSRIEHWLAQPRTVDLVEYGALPLYHLAQPPCTVYQFTSVNLLLDVYFRVKQQQVRWQENKQALKKSLENQLQRTYRKSSLREESWSQVQAAERYRLFGELLMTYLYQIQPGLTEITVINLYEAEETLITIPLLPHLSATENAQRYFKKYNRARRSLQVVQEQFKLAQQEIAYLESVNQALELAVTLEDLQEIRMELIEQGYLRPSTPEERQLREAGKAQFTSKNTGSEKKIRKNKKALNKGKKQDRKKPLAAVKEKDQVNLMPFRSTDGFEILVGKNNKQNDYLTLKVARKNDVWLHVKEIPGSHVIIRTQSMTHPRPESEPDSETKRETRLNNRANSSQELLPELQIPLQTLKEAACLAAYFSKARYSSAVPVDYTLRRHVRKPAGAKPGYVIYDHHQTIYVTPDPENLKPLLT